MTCNQLILLLEIYRGSFSPEDRFGYSTTDFDFLRQSGLIKPCIYQPDGKVVPNVDGDHWTTSTFADLMIRKFLEESKLLMEMHNHA